MTRVCHLNAGNVAFHSARRSQKFVLFLLPYLEFVQASGQVLHQGVEVGLRELHPLAGVPHAFPRVRTWTAGGLANLIHKHFVESSIVTNTYDGLAITARGVPPRLDDPSKRVILNHMVQYQRLDHAFAALADPTRRGILVNLGRRDASITELAQEFGMTLTGMKKHVTILEDAGLVTTQKVGRVRTARLGPRKLDDESAWIETYRTMLEERLDRLEKLLERNREKRQ